MEEKKAIPTLIEQYRNRKFRKKKEEIEMLRLEIEKAKLEKELSETKK